jgi:hypothetical protein
MAASKAGHTDLKHQTFIASVRILRFMLQYHLRRHIVLQLHTVREDNTMAPDLSHHINAKSRARHPSPLKDIIKFMGQDDMISLAGGE